MHTTENSNKHLDLGCGDHARNPYEVSELFGVDLSLVTGEPDEYFKLCNLVCEPIPFGDSYFNSVSAFDVIEHIPRQSVDHERGIIMNPFGADESNSPCTATQWLILRIYSCVSFT